MNQLDNSVPLALYYQLKQVISGKIAAHEWKPGEKIPTETELCSQYGVSRITVRQALSELVKEGHLVKKQGIGTFVSVQKIDLNLMSFYSFAEEFKKKGFTVTNIVKEFKLQAADPGIAKKLNLDAQDEKVYFLVRLRYADDTIFAIESTYLPQKYFPDLTADDVQAHALYDIFGSKYNIIPGSAEEAIGVTQIQETTSKLFKLRKGTPALELERITYDKNNRIVEYTIGIVRGDNFKFHVHMK